MRTAEYYNVLSNNLGEDFCVEALETKAEWGTTYYDWAVYSKKALFTNLKQEEQEEYEKEGIAPFMGGESVCVADNFNDAIRDFFYYCYDKRMLNS